MFASLRQRASPTSTLRHTSSRWSQGSWHELQSTVAAETPIALIYNGAPYVVLMATPANLVELAIGFTLSEAVVELANEIASVVLRPLKQGIEVRIEIPERRHRALTLRQRSMAGRTSCGMCGLQLLEHAQRMPAPVGRTLSISAGALSRSGQRIAAHQPLNTATGAAHAAALIGLDGEPQFVCEDVGRHNALDKLIGTAATSGVRLKGAAIFVTSRASYEMVVKAASVGAEVLCAISAATTLAIAAAEATGLTLVAFAREDRHTTYAHGHRVVGGNNNAAA